MSEQDATHIVRHIKFRRVERASGWPDVSEPLPTTAEQWHRRARAFNARQRAFWAAETLNGEPAPAAAGTRQSHVVSGLSTGVSYFALKTWDEGPNLSELSNVVEADVR